ncbi:Gfo/Idh/MocA family oxidoreductase [Dactylosporangium aurantiacum]|uniref:Gfo/Idh/MocA family oxidoreductase n=1 Tax=Dactylosporangium aurantiacum TaxID=35754 RepID=A0A9Q9IDQ6_9ACTN|nr:Gfo/Idh/MocA family oxidoreductase [Dactylosporangium aurantiacum]MDG6101573.1 Gfo/Idh/MocA family oxidoreductase [Dactylosporangium aurantiacum]UWZ52593.1 Gfo/Idh/MocA family oxidoreductase [Dactylosporangium aurantiacum]
MTPTIALIGAAGHGRRHRQHIAELGDRVRLVALGEVQPMFGEALPVYTDHRLLLAEHKPDYVVICTPPHTHLRIALDAVRAGADLLLEKPPVLDLDAHQQLSAALAETGRRCQVGFQALGSPTLPALAALDLGELTHIAVAGAWWRPASYWTRSPWAGRRAVDGALVNPFAHALMQALDIGRVRPPWTLELERFRTRDIEVEDTAALRLTPAEGPVVTVAVTLASTGFIAGDITVTGTRGRAHVVYPQDRLDGVALPGRISLLENLLSGDPLIAPLERTLPFTALAEQIMASPDPVPITGVAVDDGIAIPGIADLVRAAAERHALLTEVGDLPCAS